MRGVRVVEFKDQMAWIDHQLEEIHKMRKVHGLDYAKADLDALNAIKVDYARAEERSVSLSWIEHPEGMGR